MRTINIEINNEYVTGAGNLVAGAAGSHDDVCLRIKFGPEWQNLTKRTMWQNAKGDNTVYIDLYDADLEQGTTDTYLVPIPFAAKEFPGKMSFGVKGYTTEGIKETQATFTARAQLIVLPSCFNKDAEEAAEPDASISEQLRAQIESKQDELVSTVNIKSINGQSILGEGNLSVSVEDAVASVNGRTGDVVLDKSDVGVTNDYTNEDKEKVDKLSLSPFTRDLVINGLLEAQEIDASDVTVDSLRISGITERPMLDIHNGTPENILFNTDKTLQDYLDEKAEKFQYANYPTDAEDGQIIQLTTNGRFYQYDLLGDAWDEIQMNDLPLAEVIGYYNDTSGLSAITVQDAIDELASEKQDTLVSGQNIKTVNGQDVIGEGNLQISGEGVKVNGTLVDDILTETAYNASTNKIATMADVTTAVGDIESALIALRGGNAS